LGGNHLCPSIGTYCLRCKGRDPVCLMCVSHVTVCVRSLSDTARHDAHTQPHTSGTGHTCSSQQPTHACAEWEGVCTCVHCVRPPFGVGWGNSRTVVCTCCAVVCARAGSTRAQAVRLRHHARGCRGTRGGRHATWPHAYATGVYKGVVLREKSNTAAECRRAPLAPSPRHQSGKGDARRLPRFLSRSGSGSDERREIRSAPPAPHTHTRSARTHSGGVHSHSRRRVPARDAASVPWNGRRARRPRLQRHPRAAPVAQRLGRRAAGGASALGEGEG